MNPYPFLPTPQVDGEAQLLAINSALSLARAPSSEIFEFFDFSELAHAPSFSDIFDFSEFAKETWEVAKSSKDETGFNFLYSWKSDLGSVLTQMQSAKFKADDSEDDLLPGYDDFNFTLLGSATFSTRNGDKLSVTSKSLSSRKVNEDWRVIESFRQVNAKYVGFKDTTSDDVTYFCQVTTRGWVDIDDSQGSLTYTFNISGKDSGFSVKSNGTWTREWNKNNSNITNTSTLKLGAYAYTDTDNSLSLSFGGTMIGRNFADLPSSADINLKKVVATTADYKCTTAVLDLRGVNNFNFEPLPFDNYSQVTTQYFDIFESIMMRGANIITITNRDGAYIDAGNGADKVTGSASSDVIKGGAGKDILSGGLGADLFVYGRETAGYIRSTSVDSNNIIISPALRDLNRDTIADFKPGEDQIGIDAREIGWSDVYRGVNEITEIMPSQFKIFAAGTNFASNAATTAPLNQGVTTDKNNSYLMLVLGATSSTLFIDLDASGTIFNPVALATLTGVFTATNITNNDFVLVG